MYIQTTINKSKDGKTTNVHLLRTSYREDGKVKKRTLGNISHLPEKIIDFIKMTLHDADSPDAFIAGRRTEEQLKEIQGPSVGAILTVIELAKKTGIVQTLGSDRNGMLALWQIIARTIDQGSRLSATRMARESGASSILDIDEFDENDLYANLDWLCEQQEKIEKKLFSLRHPNGSDLFLYDITSSYFEGTENELSAFGYNRDGKKGKKQIVIGLLCDINGDPVSIQVFKGNTNDHVTVGEQLIKIKNTFGCESITIVGDRGMIKSKQVNDIIYNKMHYITAITKSQIKKLIKNNSIQMSLFDVNLVEVEHKKNRYILRRNPVRAKEIEESRDEKIMSIKRKIIVKNSYLSNHQNSSQDIALNDLQKYVTKLKLNDLIELSVNNRIITLIINEDKLSEIKNLDGCYVIKTDLPKKISKDTIHDRYKDLSKVESVFRKIKTVNLELRPINVRLESRTRGHALCVMLSYIIIRELYRNWSNFDLTVEEGINLLKEICVMKHCIGKHVLFTTIPIQEGRRKELLDKIGINLPNTIKIKDCSVDTKRKLTERRK